MVPVGEWTSNRQTDQKRSGIEPEKHERESFRWRLQFERSANLSRSLRHWQKVALDYVAVTHDVFQPACFRQHFHW